MVRKRAQNAQPRSVGKDGARPRYASIFPGRPPNEKLADRFALSEGLVDSVLRLEAELQLPVWLLVQDGHDDDDDDRWQDSFNIIGDRVAAAFFSVRHERLQKGQRIALLIDSNGGLAGASYEIAMLLRRHCGGFVAVIPRHAKSAATLLTLGADEIIMNDYAELGPLNSSTRGSVRGAN